jgi:putative lipase involved disintegration of autophagic bodies
LLHPDPQDVAAAALAKTIQDENWGYEISLTGHSLGRAVASYAGTWISADNVVNFNAARNHILQLAIILTK